MVCRLELLDGAPITAQRFLSLSRPRGDDDMFSSHFTDEELAVSAGDSLTVRLWAGHEPVCEDAAHGVLVAQHALDRMSQSRGLSAGAGLLLMSQEQLCQCANRQHHMLPQNC
jgi:hypothetical protein